MNKREEEGGSKFVENFEYCSPVPNETLHYTKQTLGAVVEKENIYEWRTVSNQATDDNDATHVHILHRKKY